MIQLVKNARLAVGVISQHLVDDPFLLYLQASREGASTGVHVGGKVQMVARGELI